jgi:thiol peroxidase
MDLDNITFRSHPVTLRAAPLKIGDLAPDFAAYTARGELLQWSDEFRDRVSIVGSLPSVALPECAAQLRVLDGNIPTLSGDHQIPLWLLTSDTPEVLRDFQCECPLHHLILLSDRHLGEFGMKYGVDLEETHLLARALFTIGRDGRIIYREIYPEIIDDPQYYRAFKAGFAYLH